MNNSKITPHFSNEEGANPKYFQFEADFVDLLQCIPMQVRMKLDNCGVKLKLVDWNHFNHSERETLVNMPCVSAPETEAYRQYLQNLVTVKTGQPAKELAIDPQPPWSDAQSIPNSVQTKAQECQADISLKQWSNLSPEQRFALIKLSRPSHENQNFVPALQEFEIIPRE